MVGSMFEKHVSIYIKLAILFCFHVINSEFFYVVVLMNRIIPLLKVGFRWESRLIYKKLNLIALFSNEKDYALNFLFDLIDLIYVCSTSSYRVL